MKKRKTPREDGNLISGVDFSLIPMILQDEKTKTSLGDGNFHSSTSIISKSSSMKEKPH